MIKKEIIDDLKDLTIDQLRQYKTYLVGEIKEKQYITRQIDKQIKTILKSNGITLN